MLDRARELLVLFVFPILIGCGGAEDEPPRADSKPERETVASESPAIAAFIERGMPSPDRPWSAEDYETALAVLKETKEEDPLGLPRKGDDQTGRLFARLVSVENLNMANNRNLPFETRLAQTTAMQLAIRSILLLYLDPQAVAGQPYGAELLALTRVLFRTFGLLFSLSDEFTEGLSAEERANPTRQEGLRMMRSGLATSMHGALATLEDVSQFKEEDLDTFAREIADILPSLWHRLEPSVQREYALRIERMSESHPHAAVRDTLGALRNALPAK